MGIDYNLHVGAVAVCRGPLWVGGHDAPYEMLNDAHRDSIYEVQPMCGEDLVEGARVFVPNDGDHGTGWNFGETSADPLPIAHDVIDAFKSDFAKELDGLRELFSSVAVEAGVYQWAS